MKTGYTISAIGHGALILWVLLGGFFPSRQHDPIEVAQVSLVSAEEYAAMTAPASAPRAVDEAPAQPAPDQPAATPEAPQPLTRPTPPKPAERPEPATAPDPAPEPDEPQPTAEVEDTPPTPPAPPSETEGETLLAEPSPPRASPRIAPVPSLAPDPAAVPDEVTAEVTAPSPDAEKPAPEVTENTAPQEASTQIVTEAEEQDTETPALTSSLRPRSRPNRPAPQPDPTPEPTRPQNDAVADAVAQAVAGGSAPATNGTGTARVGPPLTQGEKDALRVAVQSCWIVDPGSPAARVTVTVSMSMGEDGKVDGNSLKLLSDSGGDPAAIRSAFDAARRAILRCQKGGYDLPKDKYEQWRNIEITFDPSKMRK